VAAAVPHSLAVQALLLVPRQVHLVALVVRALIRVVVEEGLPQQMEHRPPHLLAGLVAQEQPLLVVRVVQGLS
jgi:hypothetical protein